MSTIDTIYKALAVYVLDEGDLRDQRATYEDGVRAQVRSVFSPPPICHDFERGEFPVLTSKFVWWKGVVCELLWFIRGETNVRSLQADDVHIWDAWADDDGELGPVYGAQLRWAPGCVDQLANVVAGLRIDPLSRRHVISLWNPTELYEMALPPCHGIAIQFYVRGDRLDMTTYQRSADLFLGLPFNLASYGLFQCIVAQLTGLKPGRMTYQLGDVHIYDRHVLQVKQQLFAPEYDSPTVMLPPVETLLDVEGTTWKNYKLTNYQHAGRLKGEVAI